MIQHQLGRKKVILIIGARQVGKSTLLKEIFGGKERVMWLNGDDPDVESILSNATSTRLKNMLAYFLFRKILITFESIILNAKLKMHNA